MPDRRYVATTGSMRGAQKRRLRRGGALTVYVLNRKTANWTFFALVLVWGCSDPRAAGFGSNTRGEGPSRESVSAEWIPVAIRGANGTATLRAEIAATAAVRSRGLMGRPRLAPDAGMLFIYPEAQPPDSGFWMYRTLIPLDIAYLDGQGDILAIRTMEPCRSALSLNCPTYPPGVPYRAALEVNSGFFARNRIAVGDRLVPPPGFRLETAE
jgi:uncharacterized membrane protein (UPF0127 family)